MARRLGEGGLPNQTLNSKTPVKALYSIEMYCCENVTKVTELTGHLIPPGILQVLICQPKQTGNMGYQSTSKSSPKISDIAGNVECKHCSAGLGFQCGNCAKWFCSQQNINDKGGVRISNFNCPCGTVLDGFLTLGATPVDARQGTGKGNK